MIIVFGSLPIFASAQSLLTLFALIAVPARRGAGILLYATLSPAAGYVGIARRSDYAHQVLETVI